MLNICCNQCGRYQQPIVDLFDRLQVKEHILICSLVQHGLITFSHMLFEGSTDSCAQSWIPVHGFSNIGPIRYVSILVMGSDVEVRWIAADITIVESITTYPYGAFLEVKYYLESIRS